MGSDVTLLLNPQLNHISTQPYITLVLVQLDMKITLHTTPPRPTPPIESQCQQYLSCYWPDFKETVNVGSWKHLEQIPKVTVTFVQTTIVQVTFVHIRNISADTDSILTKKIDLNILEPDHVTQKKFDLKFVGLKQFLDPKFIWPKVMFDLNFF